MFLLVNETTGKVRFEFDRNPNITVERNVAEFLLDCSCDEEIRIVDYAIYTFDSYEQDINHLNARRNNLLTAKMHDIYTREYDYAHKDEEW